MGCAKLTVLFGVMVARTASPQYLVMRVAPFVSDATMAEKTVVCRLHTMQDLEKSVVQVISNRGGTMLADDLIVCFRRIIKPGGRVDRLAYADFLRVVNKVAIKHESVYFGPSWILKKPPTRGL